MSKRHPLDELFKQNLREASASVPDNMWERIAHARQQKKRRRLVLLWSAVGVTTLGLLAILLFPTNTPEVGHFPLELEGNVRTTNTLAHTNSEPSELAIDLTTDAATAIPDNNSTASLANKDNKPSLGVSLDPALVSKMPSKDKKTKTPAPVVSASAVAKPSTDPAAATSADDSDLDLDENAAKIAGPHQRARTSVIAQLPAKRLVLAEQEGIKLFANHAPRCARFSNPFFRFDLEVLGGPAYAQQTLRAKTPESLEHLMQRKNTESARLSHSTGFRIAASSSVGLRLSSGLVYTQINERFTFNAGSRLLIEQIIDAAGQISYDTMQIENYQEVHRNRLSFVEVPLLLGYERRVGKFRVGLNAGAFVNLHFGAKGTVLSPATEEPIALGHEGDRNVLPIFERRATTAWYAGLSVVYNLHSRYSLIAEPYFKSYPKALSSTAYNLQQNYWMTGLQLGMRMRL